jgi:uncharacterized membrane protein
MKPKILSDEKEVMQEIIDETKREKTRLLRQSFVAFFGTIAIIGFAVSFYFFMNMADVSSVTGNVIGIKEGNFYGILILLFVCLVGALLAILWFRKFRKKYLEHRT